MAKKNWLYVAIVATLGLGSTACVSQASYNPWKAQVEAGLVTVDGRFQAHDEKLAKHDERLDAHDARLDAVEKVAETAAQDARNALKVQARLVARNVAAAPKAPGIPANIGGQRPQVAASGNPAVTATRQQLLYEQEQTRLAAARKNGSEQARRQLAVLNVLTDAGIDDASFTVIREEKKPDLDVWTGTYGGQWMVVLSYASKDGSAAHGWFYQSDADGNIIEAEKVASLGTGYSTKETVWKAYGFYSEALTDIASMKAFVGKLVLNADEVDEAKLWFKLSKPQ